MPKAFFLIIAIFGLILTQLHWGILQMIFSAFPSFRFTNKYALFTTVGIFGFGFILASIFSFQWQNSLTDAFYWFWAHWIGILFYLFFALIIWVILAYIFPAYNQVLARILLLSTALISIYGFWNASQIQVTKYEVAIENLPEQWNNKTVVLLSDTHFGAINQDTLINKIAAKVEALKPEAVFFPGDFYDGVKTDLNYFASQFAKKVQAPLGIFFATGNHDGFVSHEREIAALEQAGITVLQNETKKVGGLQIAGVNYYGNTKEEELQANLQKLNLDPTKPTILLKHQPLHIDTAAAAGISLQLSGHTHKGQMYPASLLASSIHKGYGYGLKKFNQMQIIISSGVGTWGPPMRVGSKSEIVEIKLIKK